MRQRGTVTPATSRVRGLPATPEPALLGGRYFRLLAPARPRLGPRHVNGRLHRQVVAGLIFRAGQFSPTARLLGVDVRLVA